MKSKFLATAVATVLLATFANTSQAQPGKHHGRGFEQVTVYNGKIGELSYNDDYVYDGFYLQVNDQNLFVKFPPHLGSQIVPVLKKGSNVTVNGVIHYPRHGGQEIKMVSMVVNGTTIYDTPPMKPRGRGFRNEEFVSGSGKITQLQVSKSGSLRGFVLDNKTILRVPPHNAYQLGQLVSVGATVSYTGGVKSKHEGEVAHDNYTIVHCNTITIDGTQYLVR